MHGLFFYLCEPTNKTNICPKYVSPTHQGHIFLRKLQKMCVGNGSIIIRGDHILISMQEDTWSKPETLQLCSVSLKKTFDLNIFNVFLL